MIKRKSTEVRPRNQNQSLVANLSDAARPVPPLRLLGSAADKDKSAAAPIAASAAKPKEAAPKPNPKEPLPKPKVAPASSSMRKHHNKARPQRAASQGGAKLAASHTAASNASKCADMWRTSTAPTPAQRSKSTPGGAAHTSLAAPLPQAGSSLADFRWAWKRDGNPAAAAATAGTARSGTAGTGRVDAAARIARTQQQQQKQKQQKGGGLHGGWGQEVKPLSQVLQEQWRHAETSGTQNGASHRAFRASEDEDVAVRRRRRPLVVQPPSPRAVAEAAATVLQKGWQASAETRAPAPPPTLAPPTTAAFAAARRVTDAPLPPWAVTQAGQEAAEAAAARAVAAAAAAAVAEVVAAGGREEEDHSHHGRRSSEGGDSPAARRPPPGPKLRTASGYSRAAKEDPLPDGWQPAIRSGEEVFIHVSGLTLRTRRAVEMYEKMQAQSSGATDRGGAAKDRGADARAAYASRGVRHDGLEAAPDSRENSPRGGGSGSPLAGSPRSPTGAVPAAGMSSPERIRRQRRRSEAAQIALFEAMAPGGGGEAPGRARAQSAGNLPLFNKEHQARMRTHLTCTHTWTCACTCTCTCPCPCICACTCTCICTCTCACT
jgi:hypothetical protein